MNKKNVNTDIDQLVDLETYRTRCDFEDAEGYEYNDLEPWMPYADDFIKGDFYYAKSRPYRIWYEYLRMSPTFALAEKYIRNDGKLTAEELNSCPDDFLSDIVPTCADMKLSFAQGSFDVWWQRYGADIFGMKRSQPEPITVFNAGHHIKVDATEIQEHLKSYLENGRVDYGNTGFMLMAVPLSGDRKKVIASVSKLINEHDWQPLGRQGIKTYKLYSKRVHLETLHTNLRVLWHRALDPESALWRLGLKAQATDYTIYTRLDPEYDTGTPESLVLASITSNRIKYAINTMENAIRGRFPCDKDDLLPPINQRELLKGVSRIVTNRCNNYKFHRLRQLERIASEKHNDNQQNSKANE